MSGSKRKSGYRKNVISTYDDGVPSLVDGVDIIAKIKSNRGSNLFDVEIPNYSVDGAGKCIEHVAILPNKFKNLIWIKRNDYVIIQNINNLSTNTQQYDIKNILKREHIKHYKSAGKWPSQFDTETIASEVESQDTLCMENLSYNPNRVAQLHPTTTNSYLNIDDLPPTEDDGETDYMSYMNHDSGVGNAEDQG